jgi:hypothetical protein
MKYDKKKYLGLQYPNLFSLVGLQDHAKCVAGASLCLVFLSDIHSKDPIGNKRKCFHGSSLEWYQLIIAF